MISVKINIIPLKKSSEIRSQASMQNSKNEKAQGLTAPQEEAESHDAEQRNEWEAERDPPLNGSTSPLASSWGEWETQQLGQMHTDLVPNATCNHVYLQDQQGNTQSTLATALNHTLKTDTHGGGS